MYNQTTFFKKHVASSPKRIQSILFHYRLWLDLKCNYIETMKNSNVCQVSLIGSICCYSNSCMKVLLKSQL
jgi:hypothetical protein